MNQSCQKMLETQSTIVTFEQNHKIGSASDSVYSVLGIISKMQAIADQTVLMGEVRGDLVGLTDTASVDLKNMAAFNFDVASAYNIPQEYYAVINNCNYFLTHVDTNLIRNNRNVFEREFAAVSGFRAWTYIQLALTYGTVPFVLEPITSGNMADANKYKFLNITEIAEALIPTLEPLVNKDLPDYAEINKHKSNQFFIPVRLILGDLYLWSGRYLDAAKTYHDYLSSTQQERYNAVGTQHAYYSYITEVEEPDKYCSEDYSSDMKYGDYPICYIPMEDTKYDGVISNLSDIFESTTNNRYYNQASYSNALSRISAAQTYCYTEAWIKNGLEYLEYYYYNAKDFSDAHSLYKGDLRLRSVISSGKNSSESEMENDIIVNNNKILDNKIPMYRLDVVYLRLAEALNRAGMSQMAFCILKYGLTEDVIDKYVPEYEKKIAKAYNLLDWDDRKFVTYYVTPYGTQKNSYEAQGDYAASNTLGIHSRGSGDARNSAEYVLPTPSQFDMTDTLTQEYNFMSYEEQDRFVDSLWIDHLGNDANFDKDYYLSLSKTEKQDYVESIKEPIEINFYNNLIPEIEEIILDEMALDLAFEGYRFGDLVRIALHRAGDTGKGRSGYIDNEFIARHVAARNIYCEPQDGYSFYKSEGKEEITSHPRFDNELYSKLNTGTELNPAMFMQLPQ